jgi:cullin-4
LIFPPQIYKDAFDKKFLAATEKMYAAEGQRLVNERDVPEYLVHVEKRIKEENERLVHYLDQSSKWQLIYTVEKQVRCWSDVFQFFFFSVLLLQK